MRNLDWMGDALCAQVGPDLFFPEVPGQNVQKARTICGRCPVLAQCEEHARALEGNAAAARRHGAWGGRSPKERAVAGGVARSVLRDEQIRRLSDCDMSPTEIAAVVGCTPRTVSRVRAAHRQQQEAV